MALYQNNYRYWWWGNHQSQGEYESQWDNSWNRSHDYSHKNTTVTPILSDLAVLWVLKTAVLTLATAITRRNLCQRRGTHSAGDSDLLMGSGSDTISISTNADGVIGSAIPTQEAIPTATRYLSLHHSNYHNNEYSSRNWWICQSSSEGNYDYKSKEYTNKANQIGTMNTQGPIALGIDWC